MTPERVTRAAGLLVLGGYFLVFCALVLGAGAAWHAYREHVEASRWPAATAELSDCRVHTWYDGVRGRARSSHYVECSFRYDVREVPYRVQSKVGDAISIVRGEINLTRPPVTLSALQRWVKRHPPGTTETIHYDPAHPERISLVGVNDDIKWQTTAGYVRGVVAFALGGLVLLLLGILLGRRATGRASG